MTQLASVNYLSVLVATIAAFSVGAIWYGTLSKAWIAAQGKTMEQVQRESAEAVGRMSAFLPFVIVFVSDFLMAMMLYGIMVHVGLFSVRAGMFSGAMIWLGFVITSLTTNYAFQHRKVMLTVIDGGHWLAVLLVIGAILGAFGR